jgi:hypothetical protein
MDLVLGLSLTSAAVRWVFVEGTSGEGAPIDRGSLDIPAIDTVDIDLLLDAVLNPDVVAQNRIHMAGVTTTDEAQPLADAVLEGLAARGHGNVVAVSDSDAADALARGIANITTHEDVAVCIVEPDAALVALVDAGGVTVDRIDRPLDQDDALELTSSVIAVLGLNVRRPDAIFVVGSDDVDVIVSSFEAIVDAPVFSAAEADLALARGAALASAQTVDASSGWGARLRARLTSRIGVLSTVLAAAVVTFVVSLSIALGLSLAPDAVEQPRNANAAVEPAPVAVPPSVKQAAPARPVAPPPAPVPEVAETIAVAVPPAPVAAPVYQAPPVYQPPAPAYVPPAPPPAYVPPPVIVPPNYPQPRLRDRIIEKIPIINRFHDP